MLAGQKPVWNWDHIFELDSFTEIRVTRPWRAQLVNSAGETFEYYPNDIDETLVGRSISVTAAIEREMFSKLIIFTNGALSQIEAEEDNS